MSQSLPLRSYRTMALACVLVFLALAGCGGNALKSAADEAVKGTAFEVRSVTKTGDNAGTVVAETDDGSKIKIDLSDVKDAGDFVLDGCQNLQDAGYDCTDLDGSPQP
jgi:coenzyme F420-reducing hydrogenase beta subunit